MASAEVVLPQGPSPPPGPKKRVIRVRRKATPSEPAPEVAMGDPFALPESNFPPEPLDPLSTMGSIIGSPVPGKKKPPPASFDILGDPADFEAQLAEYNARTEPEVELGPQVDIDTLPSELLEAVMIAPDGGKAILSTYESIANERSSLQEQLATLREKQGEEMLRQTSVSSVAPLLSPRGTPKEGSTKWNSGPPLYQVLEHEVEATQYSALEKHASTMRVWNRQRDLLTRMAGRKPGELVMERQFEYRRKLEELHHLHMAIPLEDRHGSNQWTMSLRDNWTRYVPVGNVFSGLFCPVEENPGTGEVEYIAKPGAAEDPLDTLQTSLGRGRNWLHSQTLTERKRRYSRRMHSISGHAPDFEGLQVFGSGVEHVLEDQATKMITLDEVEARLAEADPAAWEGLQEARAARAAAEAAEAALAEEARLEAEAAQRAKQPVQGPAIELAAQRLHLECSAGHAARQVLRAINTGSTALYYHWSRRAPPVAIPCATGAGGPDRFYLNDQSGSILPGEVKEFVFGFKSAAAGMFTDEWQLETSPHTAYSIAPVMLRGVATATDAHRLQRRNMDSELAEREKMSAVANAIDRILSLVEVPAKPRVIYPLLGAACDDEGKFLAANQAAVDPAAYYSPAAYQRLNEIFDECQALLAPPPPTEEEVAAAEAARAAAAKKGEEVEEAPPPPPPPPFGGGVGEVEAAVAAVAEAGGHEEAAGAMAAEVMAIAEAARRPEVQHRFHKHAMFEALGALGDFVEARAVDLKEQLVAEAVAAAAAAAEAAAAAAAAGEGGEEEDDEDAGEDDLDKLAEEGGAPKKRPPRPPTEAAAEAAEEAAEDEDEWDEEVDGPRPPKYDVAQFQALLKSSTSAELGGAVDGFQAGIAREKESVAGQIRAQIGAAYEALEGAEEGGEEAVALRWEIFNLERWKVSLGLLPPPPPPSGLSAPLPELEVGED